MIRKFRARNYLGRAYMYLLAAKWFYQDAIKCLDKGKFAKSVESIEIAIKFMDRHMIAYQKFQELEES